MNQAEPNQADLDRLARIAPIVRGLLAEPTGDEDIRHCPVILACHAGPGDKATDEGNPPLSVDIGDAEQDDDALRELLASAIAAHRSQHGCKPKAIRFEGLGSMNVVATAQWDPQRPLEGRVALVTGAAGAIGYGICKRLLESGCYLVATDLAGAKLDEFVSDMEQISSGRVMGVAIDVTDTHSMAAGFAQVAATWGGVDIVVHNAGIAHVSTLAEMDLDTFARISKVNVDGTLKTIAEAARMLIAQGTGGDMVIMSTKNVPSPSAGFGAYSATKAACHQLGRIASLELAPHDIRVNMVAPDAVFAEGKYKSGLWQEVGENRMKARGLDEKGLHEYYRQRNLLKAKVTGRHVANAVLFFLTRQTPTTGATIPVDGGLPDATPR
jgi:NAD(P)-dependent dehydrogenase (short-subunit alcohol dehydrogenase family)